MTVLIDSWAWIEFLKGSAAGKRVKPIILDRGRDAIVSTVNVSEVFRWFLANATAEAAEDARGLLQRRCEVVDFTEPLAVEAARIRHERKWGLGDSIVLATAQAHGATIVTGDPDFRGLDDVNFVGDAKRHR